MNAVHIPWQEIMAAVFNWVTMLAAALGFGSGVGVIKLIKHWPAPPSKRSIMGGFFDAFQDIVSNDERVGERTDEAGNIVYLMRPARPFNPNQPQQGRQGQ